jgi:hypothetical protein
MKPKSLHLILYVMILALFLTACSAAFTGRDPWALTMPIPTRGLFIGLGLVVAFLVGYWLIFRHRPVERLSALQSTLLLTCLIFQLRFMGVILHEGGHALYQLIRGFGITLYVHPFAFSAYSRPMADWSAWTHVSGSAVALPAALLISLPFWKRRSLSNLPFLMLFPWVAINDGMYMLQRQGDYHNLMQVTGVPGIVLIVVGGLIACVGLILWFSLLPLLGVSPKDKKAFLVIPAAMFLWAFSSMIVAHLVVPGSPFAIKYALTGEIVSGANDYYFIVILGVIFALLYLTLYRWVYPRLPVGLRVETVNLTWKDFRLPGLLFVVSLVLGLMIIT